MGEKTRPATTAAHEEKRLDALRRYHILDSLPEPALDDLTRLAAQICGTPISLISLVDEHRQWFKSRFGLETTETPRELSFCAHALHQHDLLLVPDATKDERFAHLPNVLGPPGIRSYAGAPLVTSDGAALGTVCVIDRRPRAWSEAEQEALRILSRQVVAQIEMRCQSRELAESERMMRGFFDAKPECVKLLTANCEVLMMNRAGLQIIGADAVKDIEGLSLFPLIAERDRAQFKDLTRRVFAGESGTLEFDFTSLTGSKRRLEIRAAPLRDDAGAVTALLGVSTDLTERMKSRKQLELLRACVERLNDIVFITEAEPVDEPGPRIVFVNEAFERISGYQSEEVLGRSPRFLQGPGTSRAELSRVREALQKREPVRAELINYTKTGVEYWVELDITPITGADGRPTHFMAIERDITERKRQDEKALRTQRMEVIGTLAGGIAHDLNNMLSPIVTSIELLKIQFPDPASQELLAIVETNARRGADMVRQVLSFARGVEGRRMEVQLTHVFREIQKIVRDTFLKQIEVRTTIPNGLWTVLGDPTQLHQVILNLCLNARDAMPDGGTLTLAAENVGLDPQFVGTVPEARPGPHVMLSVSDSGTGIAPEILARIFDPFFTTKELGKGTGLGLSSSLGIVRSHGGFMRVTSEPGAGSNFRVYLPAQDQAAAPARVASPETPEAGRGELILVVDDEEGVRTISKRTLEAFGYRVVLAGDGTEALAAYAQRATEIAAVITDMNMPVMDGAAAIRVLRRMNPTLPIVAASGLAARPEVATLGVTHFLPKPYTAVELLKVLREALAGAA